MIVIYKTLKGFELDWKYKIWMKKKNNDCGNYIHGTNESKKIPDMIGHSAKMHLAV